MKPAAGRAHLADAWVAAARAAGARGDLAGAGAALLARWSEPHRHYHNLDHLAAVLAVVDDLAAFALSADTVRLAAFFHDAVYDPRAADNEERSAGLARTALRGLRVDPDVVADVARLVLLTTTHAPAPDDRDGAVLCDADLAVLGSDADGYAAYASAVRREYAHVRDGDFARGRSAVLRSLLDRPSLYATAAARARFEERGRRNIAAELILLGAGPAADGTSAAPPRSGA